MQKVIIAAAPITKEKFHPVCAEFPISDKALLSCVGSQTATNEIMDAACKMLGVSSHECVTGMYCALPDRPNRPFEVFLHDLEKRHGKARAHLMWQQQEVLRQRRQNTFCTILTLQI